MEQKTYFFIVGTVFSIISVLHAIRLITGWEAVIGGWQVPIWLSWIAMVTAGYLVYSTFSLRKKVAR